MILSPTLLSRAVVSLLTLSYVPLVNADAGAGQEQCVLHEEVIQVPQSLDVGEKFLGSFGDGGSCEAECAKAGRPKRRVAIIGAGSAGTSAAYFLRDYSYNAGIPVEITIYERNDYIGGRSTTVIPFLDQDEESSSDLHGGNGTASSISRDKYPGPIELGASIFISDNYNMVNASRDLNLTTIASTSEAGDDASQATGIWNGRKFVFIEQGSDSSNPVEKYWNMVKMIWRYGVLGPYRTTQLVRKIMDSFLQIYQPSHFPFKSLSRLVEDLGLVEYVGQTALDMLDRAGARANTGASTKDGGFVWEIVQAATRVNYASNLEGIHGVGAMVCMAPTLSDDDPDGDPGVMQVQGGNWQIFQGMASAAKADIKLGWEVTEIAKANSRSSEDKDKTGSACNCAKNAQTSKETYRIRSRKSKAKKGDPPRSSNDEIPGQPAYEEEDFYDTIILAAPFQSAYIKFGSDATSTSSSPSTNDLPSSAKPLLQHTPSPIPYKTLHVTLFAANKGLASTYFNVSDSNKTPGTVLTTLPPPKEDNFESRPEFYSISTLRSGVQDPACTEPSNGKKCDKLRLYKIFSAEKMSDKFIEGTLLEDQASISWIYRKIWKSYPILRPRKDGVDEPLRLDTNDEDMAGEELGLGGIWYTAGIEPFISTMETSSLMGKNVARLIADEWEISRSSSRLKSYK